MIPWGDILTWALTSTGGCFGNLISILGKRWRKSGDSGTSYFCPETFQIALMVAVMIGAETKYLLLIGRAEGHILS